MIHGTKLSGELYEQSQEYDIHGRVLFSSLFYFIILTPRFRPYLLSTVGDSTKRFWMN
jgi:hypothetical protein